MAPPLKSVLWQQIKSARELGIEIPLDKPYVVYTEDELRSIYDQYVPQAVKPEDDASQITDLSGAIHEPVQQPDIVPPLPRSEPVPEPTERRVVPPRTVDPDPFTKTNRITEPEPEYNLQHGAWPLERIRDLHAQTLNPSVLSQVLNVPLSDIGSERAGLTFNSHGRDDVVRVDSSGRVWYMDEVIKPSVPKARMQRKVRYIETGSKTVNKYGERGQIEESYEVAGDLREEREIRVTVPSYQTGLYKDPRMPFRICVYNNVRGFMWRDIVHHYGGADLVPATIKRIYVSNELCFDIPSTIATIEKEHRDMIMFGARNV